MNKKTSFIQNFLLVIVSLILTAILLELSLRAAGGLVLYLQQKRNHVSFNSNEYRILCLGESTTALGGEDSYPSLLEDALNQRNRPIKFTVINEGIISTTSKYILEHIDRNLEKYKPQLVIVMMGINDKAYLHNTDKRLWWENIKAYFEDFRVYKLFRLLSAHIYHRIHDAKQLAVDPSLVENSQSHNTDDFLKLIILEHIQQFSQRMQLSQKFIKENNLSQALQEKLSAQDAAKIAGVLCVELAKRYRLESNFREAQTILRQASVLYPSFTGLYQEWGELYLSLDDAQDAVRSFQTAVGLDQANKDALRGLARAYFKLNNPNAFIIYSVYLKQNPQDYWGYIELAQWLRKFKHDDLAEAYLAKAIDIGPDLDQAYLDMGEMLDEQGLYNKEESFYLKEISLKPKNPKLYQALGQFYQRQGRADLSNAYFKKTAQCLMREYMPDTLVNYSLLVNKILEAHSRVIIMQYPLRDVYPLVNYIGPKKGVIYVENQENFKKALNIDAYSKYFKDNFAYNFGHCTRAGNQLIADHLLDVILKKIL